uniref:Saccharopine dehydrogenase NADP binding domain-containing protein n=1 Tax=Ditylum brightwellii TaxID=49249 RepID=A0A7S4VUY8_9STRA
MNSNNSNNNTQNRDFDLIIWGATGFTGKLACAYLSNDTSKFYSYNLQNVCTPQNKKDRRTIKWAVAGRSKSKLSSLLSSVSAPSSTPIFVIPSIDDASKPLIDDMVSKTKCIVSLAGPFQLYSDSIVESCCRLGTHYVDVTGEPLWVRRCVDRGYDEMAKRSGACIVNFCGYDSIPSDIGCLFALGELEKMKEGEGGGGSTLHRKVTCYQCVFDGGKPSMSGGTLASDVLTTNTTQSSSSSSSPTMIHPHLFSENSSNNKNNSNQFQTKAWYSKDVKSWVGPFPMEKINVPATNRSAYFLNYAASSSLNNSNSQNKFSYQEVAVAPTQKAAMKLERLRTHPIPPSKMEQMIEQGRLPKPGQGPTPSHRSVLSFMALLVAEEEEDPNNNHETKERKVCVAIKGGDPGYEETSKMVIESALCLILQPNSCPGLAKGGGGFQSSAMCMGRALITRLQHAGIQFLKVEDAKKEVDLFWSDGMKRMMEMKEKKGPRAKL